MRRAKYSGTMWLVVWRSILLINGCQNYAALSTVVSIAAAAHVLQPNTVFIMRTTILIKKEINRS